MIGISRKAYSDGMRRSSLPSWSEAVRQDRNEEWKTMFDSLEDQIKLDFAVRLID
jgi:hypothetical protein